MKEHPRCTADPGSSRSAAVPHQPCTASPRSAACADRECLLARSHCAESGTRAPKLAPTNLRFPLSRSRLRGRLVHHAFELHAIGVGEIDGVIGGLVVFAGW